MNINIDKVNIHYEILGEGKPLLILHGWGGCINSMYPLIEYYKKSHKVITLDFPSHGESSMIENWNVTDYMNNLYNFLQELKIEKVDIICHSFGGRVSILLAALHPEMVDKLVLIDSGGMLCKRTPKYYAKLYSYKIAKHLMKLKYRNKEEYDKWLEEERKKRSSNDFNALKPEMRSTFIKVVNQNLKPYLKKITAPTVLIWGEFDKDTPIYMAKQINKGIKGSTLHILENCGHFSYLDDFNSVVKIIDEFI